MPDEPQNPALEITLQLTPHLLALIEDTAGLADGLRQAVAAGVADLLAGLGLPGEPVIVLASLEADGGQGQFLRLSAAGVTCRYPDRLLALAYSFVTGTPLQPADLGAIAGWLEESPAAGEPERLVRFLGTACTAILKLDPACLLTPAQLDAYFAALPEDAARPDLPPETLLDILRELLHMRLSLRDRGVIAGLIHHSAAAGSSLAEITEALIAALRPAHVVFYLPPEELQRLPVQAPEDNLFVLMRDGLFYELGMRYPDFRIVPDPALPPHSFSIKINDVAGLPWTGLDDGELLVNESVERLRLLSIDAVEGQNPANDNDAAIVATGRQQRLEEAGLTTWDPLGYLVLCFSRELREASAALFDRDLAAGLLYQLGEVFPALIDALYQQVSLDFATRVLRRLLAEQIPIRNLREIAELILRFDTIVVDSRRHIVFDDRFPVAEPLSGPVDPETMTAYIRTGTKLALSHRLTRGQNTLVVYLLAPELEEALTSGAPEPGLVDRLLAAIREESEGFPPGTTVRPAILTDASVRASLQALVGQEFPHLPVVAYQELSPALNIQPIARLDVPL